MINKTALLKSMVIIANELDEMGMVSDANKVDGMMNKVGSIIKEGQWGILESIGNAFGDMYSALKDMPEVLKEAQSILEKIAGWLREGSTVARLFEKLTTAKGEIMGLSDDEIVLAKTVKNELRDMQSLLLPYKSNRVVAPVFMKVQSLVKWMNKI